MAGATTKTIFTCLAAGIALGVIAYLLGLPPILTSVAIFVAFLVFFVVQGAQRRDVT